MKSVYRRCFFGWSLFSVSVGTSALVTLLGTVPACIETGSGVDGGLDQAGGNSAGLALSSVIPSSGLAVGGNKVSIVGTGFAPGATVTFGATPATEVQLLSTTQLSVVVPASAGFIGRVAVTVKNPNGATAAKGDIYSYYRVQVALQPAITAPTGNHPVALAAADINDDKYKEIITANQGSSDVTVLAYNQSWNNGVAYPAATGPTSLVVADFNSNGYPDVAVACSSATGNDIAVLSDNGGIGFRSPINIKVAMNVVAIDARDLNGDGKPDLVAAARSTGLAYVLLNNTMFANLVFTPGSTFPLGNQPSGLVLGDVNGDGKLDIVATNFGDSTLSVLLGLGNASFGSAKFATTATQPIAIALGDLNKDGKPDVVTTSFNSKQVSVLLGTSDGTFPTLRNLPAGEKPMSIAIADIDRDGISDLVFANSGENTVTVLLGQKDGTFDSGQSFLVGSQPVAVLVEDLNNDGKLDIATANYNSSDISILYNQIP